MNIVSCISPSVSGLSKSYTFSSFSFFFFLLSSSLISLKTISLHAKIHDFFWFLFYFLSSTTSRHLHHPVASRTSLLRNRFNSFIDPAACSSGRDRTPSRRYLNSCISEASPLRAPKAAICGHMQTKGRVQCSYEQSVATS